MAEANAVWYITTADDRGTTQRPRNLHRPNAGSKASTQYDILAFTFNYMATVQIGGMKRISQ